MGKAFGYMSAAVALLALAACGQRPMELTADPKVQPSTVAEVKTAVPQIAAMPVGEVDKLLAQAGLIPILRFEPGVVSGAGSVIGTDPPAGTMLAHGQVVTVLIAGPPGDTLDEYVAAHRETFVGIGLDANGVIVIGVHQQADLQREMPQLSQLAKGKAFRVQSCSRTFADLQRIQLELARRDFVPGADKIAFATTIDPLACAIRLTIELSDAEVAQLTARYQGALVIQKGTAKRGG